MHRIFEKRDNQPVSMIYDNPTSESFTKFRDMIRKSSEEQMNKYRNNQKTKGYSNKYNMPSGMI